VIFIPQLLRTESGAAIGVNELQDPLPGIGGLVGELGLVPVEETVRSARVDNQLVGNVCRGQRLIEGVNRLAKLLSEAH